MNSQSTYFEDLIKSRRTIHDFISDKIPDKSIIKEAIKIACWAPNHHLTEPWHFYLLGQETIEGICKLNREMMMDTQGSENAEKKFKRWRNIPGWIIVTCKKSKDNITYQEDYAACCCAIQNLLLFLWHKDIGTKWSTGKVIRDDRCYEIAWIDKSIENIIGLIWYGYPVESTSTTTRKNLEQILNELP